MFIHPSRIRKAVPIALGVASFEGGPFVNKSIKQCLRFLTCLFAGAFILAGQADLGSLSGTINDPSGATVTGAQVTIMSKSTGAERTATADSSGYYLFSSLPIGAYDVAFDHAGFERTTSSVTIDAGNNTRLDVQLTVGAASASVEVTAAIAGLNHDSANVGMVLDNQVIVSTPLFMRRWDDLMRLGPGGQQNRYTEQGGATASGRTGDFQVNGVHSLQNDFILDGIDDNTFSENVQELSTEGTRPSVDVIQEFKVVTNPYSAEYGRSPGAAVDVSTKG